VDYQFLWMICNINCNVCVNRIPNDMSYEVILHEEMFTLLR
jgi:hypothetical protein